jgi:hypothetical protein
MVIEAGHVAPPAPMSVGSPAVHSRLSDGAQRRFRAYGAAPLSYDGCEY